MNAKCSDAGHSQQSGCLSDRLGRIVDQSIRLGARNKRSVRSIAPVSEPFADEANAAFTFSFENGTRQCDDRQFE